MRIWKQKYEAGSWKAECDRCGFDYKNYQLRREWTGLMVCRGPGTNDCWEPRHPQDQIQGVPDRQAPEWVRPGTVSEPFVNEGGTDTTPDDL